MQQQSTFRYLMDLHIREYAWVVVVEMLKV